MTPGQTRQPPHGGYPSPPAAGDPSAGPHAQSSRGPHAQSRSPAFRQVGDGYRFIPVRAGESPTNLAQAIVRELEAVGPAGILFGRLSNCLVNYDRASIARTINELIAARPQVVEVGAGTGDQARVWLEAGWHRSRRSAGDPSRVDRPKPSSSSCLRCAGGGEVINGRNSGLVVCPVCHGSGRSALGFLDADGEGDWTRARARELEDLPRPDFEPLARSAGTRAAIAAADAIWWTADRIAGAGEALEDVGSRVGELGHRLLEVWANHCDPTTTAKGDQS